MAKSQVGLAGSPSNPGKTDLINSRALAAVLLLLDTRNRICRGEPDVPVCTVDAAAFYRASVAAVLRLMVLHRAEVYGLLPSDEQITAPRAGAEVPPRSPASLGSDGQSSGHLWRRAMQWYEYLGRPTRAAQVAAAPSVDSVSSWSRLLEALPVDNWTFRGLIDLLFPGGESADPSDTENRDIEQIGATYAWLCGYTARRAANTLVRPKGRGSVPNTVPLQELEKLAARNHDDLLNYLQDKTGRNPSALARDLTRADTHAVPLSGLCGDDSALSARLRPFASLLDLRASGTGCVFLAGDLYLTTAGARRRTGIHYTSRWMIEEVVRQTLDPLVYVGKSEPDPHGRPGRLRTAEEILQLRVCDMAMGCGAFILEVCRYLGDRLVDAVRHTGIHEIERRREGPAVCSQNAESTMLPVAEARRLVATHCLYGVDIDSLAVELARASLWLLIADGSLAPATLGRRLRHGDSLVGMPGRQVKSQDFESATVEMGQELQTRKTETGVIQQAVGLAHGARPLHWPAEYPEVFVNSGGFDAIIGNPPFGNAIEAATAREPAFAQYARTQFDAFALGAADYCLLFWGRALLHLLRPQGRFGWISPTTLLSDQKPWRQWVHAHARPDVLIRFPVHAFTDARIRTSAICGGLGQAPRVLIIDHDSGPTPRTATIAWTDDLHSWHEACERAFGTFSNGTTVAPGLDRCRLGTLPLDLFAGSTTSTAYELRPHIIDQLRTGGPRLITTGALDRYSCNWGHRRIRYLKRDYVAPYWPSSSAIPPDIARARDRQRGSKIIIGGLTAVIEAWLDETGSSAGTVSTWIIRPGCGMALDTLFLLLAVLNSATFSRIYMQRHGARAMSGKQTTIQKRALLEMPVPPALVSYPMGPPTGAAFDLREAGAQTAICHRVGRLLQNSSPGSVTWARLDKLGHVVAGLLYGRSLDAALDDYDWWCGRAGQDREPAPVSELVELLRCSATPCTPSGSNVD